MSSISINSAANASRPPNGGHSTLGTATAPRDKAETVKDVLLVNGVFVGIGAVGCGLGMALAGMHGMAAPMLGSSVARNFLKGAGIGALGGAAVGGWITLVGLANSATGTR